MINYHNHELFRQIYGDFEYARLRAVFETEPEELTTGSDWDVPELIHTTYVTRLIFFAGIGSKHFLKKVLTHPVLTNQVSSFVFVENDDKVISNIVNSPEFPKLVQNVYIKFMFKQDENNFRPNLFRILKQPNYSEVMELGCIYFNKTEANEISRAFYEKIDGLVQETVQHIYHNYGRIDDSIEGMSATLKNYKRLLDNPGIQDLKNKYKGLPAVIVGAGPSLDQEIAVLKANNNKFVVIAADAAVKPLVNAGVRVDFCTSIERGNIYQKPFWTDLDPKETQLVCYPVVHPEVLDLYKGTIRMVYRNYSYYAYFENAWPKGILASGGSTSNLALRLAHYMGCSEIILVGIDNAYQQDLNLYRSHCSNTGYPDWSEWVELESFKKNRSHAPAFIVPANDGNLTMTNHTYYQWSKELSEELINLNIPITTTASFGVKMADIPYLPFSTKCDQLQTILKYPDNTPARPTYYRHWNHEVVTESLVGWIKTCADLTAVLNEDLTKDLIICVEEIHHRVFKGDDLFVSFVVQNCAVEYYRLDNKFNALPTDRGEKITERSAVFKDRLAVYKEVCLKLLNAFKEAS